MRKPGGEGGRRAGVSDPDNCRAEGNSCGQRLWSKSNKRREQGNTISWSQARIITTVMRSMIWSRQQGIQGFMTGS